MRIQLEVPTGKDERIKQWMKDAGFKTYSELFNNTMSVFTWVANEVKHGRIVISQDPSGQTHEKQFSMPFMDVLAPLQQTNEAPSEKSLAAKS